MKKDVLLDYLEKEKIRLGNGTDHGILLEKVINMVLKARPLEEDPLDLYSRMAREVREFSTDKVRTVVFGGGAGLSSILGGDSSLEGWAGHPFRGLKEHFKLLSVVVCTTDDGGSSGDLIRRLPLVALGDIRRVILSSITPRGLKSVYGRLTGEQVGALPGLLGKIINHRFKGKNGSTIRKRKTILTLLPKKARALLPEALALYLDETWTRILSHGALASLPLESHCLGNLLLASEIYGGLSGREGHRPVPTHEEMIKGIQKFARMAGAGSKRIWPATTSQGELRFLYTNGVVISGEHKSSVSRRGFPVDRVWAEYVGKPRVDARVLKAVAEADLIVIAPGSVYSSLLPVLQIPEIAGAIRRNRRALKVLGANFWVQKGETDITVRDLGKEFCVSDLVEAYNKNIEAGSSGLFRQVVTSNLENIPAEIIQNYALEGKVPIYLDKERVNELGFASFAVEVHDRERLVRDKVFQHDPDRFAQTIRILLYLKKFLRKDKPGKKSVKSRTVPKGNRRRTLLLSDHMQAAQERLDSMKISPARLRRLLHEIIWENRDISLRHLQYIDGIKVVPREKWTRSTMWDRILTYYDPADSCLKIRSDLLDLGKERLTEDLLIGLGESLLGNYAASKSIHLIREKGTVLGKVFEIVLRPERELRAFLSREKIREYLCLAKQGPVRHNADVFHRVINMDESFTPPGLLFGLMYAWYLDNRFGCVIEYEMSLLKRGVSDLIPKPTMDRERRRRLIDFFRREVFLH